MVVPMDKRSRSRTLTVRRILAPTDFSPDAERAVQWAVHLGGLMKAQVIVVFVLDITLGAVAGLPPQMAGIDATGQLLARIRREAAGDMRRLGRRYPQVTTMIREGSPRPTILRTADRLRADLIVIGTRGRTGLAHAVFGSVAEHVVRYARMPVLIVRKRGRT